MTEQSNPLIRRDDIPSEAELQAARDAFNQAVGWKPPANPPPPAAGPAGKASSRRHWKTVNWGRAAELMAGGASIAVTAAALGCDPARILRNLRRSAKFRHRIDRAHDQLKLAAHLRFVALGEDATRQMQHHAERFDPRMLQWLGEKLQLDQAGVYPMIEQLVRAVRAAPRRKQPERPAGTGPNGTKQAETGRNGTEQARTG